MILGRIDSWVLGAIVALSLPSATVGSGASSPGEYRAALEADWLRQEQRLGRQPYSVEAVRAAWERGQNLLADRNGLLPDSPAKYSQQAAALRQAGRDLENLANLDEAGRKALYLNLRWAVRELALSNPALADRPLVFLKRQRFICQMLHEYLGYFYDYGDVAGGGGVFVLEKPGQSMETRDLLAGRLVGGNFTTLALSHDGRTIYFAFAERAPVKPDFYSAQRKSFHLYRINVDGTGLRQLTHGVEDDFDPSPLPDGGLAFMSSRRGGFCRCNNPWEPIPTYTLHRMQADGSDIKTLSWHETNEWHPFALNDGRIVYIRWDYVDRSAANYHGLWSCNPDGSNPISLFGNYTTRINACYQPRAVPGSDKILFVAGAHHADVGGSLVMLDVKRATYDRKSGEDAFDSIEVLTPEICFPEAPGWPKSYFHSPWPLSENYHLAAFSHDPLPGMSSGEKNDTRTGLYYFDRFGNLELLYQDAEASSMYPIPLAPRPAPPMIASTRDENLGGEGEFVLAGVNRSFFPLPADRPIRELRVFQVLPKTHNHIANQPRIGHANAESARLLLGSVPVEPDGSAYFRAPAQKALYFQAVDKSGRAVQTMRSITYLQPGERRGCVGCHEPPRTAAEARPLLALRRPPSSIVPGPDGTKPLSYPRLVQPVLDSHCVRCHDGSEGPGKSRLALDGGQAKNFTRSYNNLKPYLRWYEWGGASITQTVTRPGRQGADESKLTAILTDANHQEVRLADADRRRLYLWLDANVPFYGTYSTEEHHAQLLGEALPPPALQ